MSYSIDDTGPEILDAGCYEWCKTIYSETASLQEA
jgi:hypothetical protein